MSWTKEKQRRYNRAYHRRHRKRLCQASREYRKTHRKQCLSAQRRCYRRRRKQYLSVHRAWYRKNRLACTKKQRQWVEENADRVKANHQAYHKVNRVRRLKLMKKYAKSHRTQRRVYLVRYSREQRATLSRSRRKQHLRRRFGITLEDFDRMVSEQKGLCALCSKTLSTEKRHPHVDHDHTTGRIRGVVHHNCNLVLGHAKDSVELLQQAIAYLQR